METDRPEGWNGVAAGGASAGLPPAGFLSRIASAIDVPSSSAHAESTLDAGLAPRRDWPLALSQAGRALGLRARPVDHVVHDLHGQIGARRALVSWHAELGWLALIGASRGRLTLIRAGSADEIIEPEALAARLGIDACEAEHWMQVEPEFAAASPGAPERPTPVGRLFALLLVRTRCLLEILWTEYIAKSGLARRL